MSTEELSLLTQETEYIEPIETPPQEPEKKKMPKWLIIDVVLLGAAVLSLVIYYVLRRVPGFATIASNGFSTPIREFLGSVMKYIPFSVAEWFYVVVIVFVLFHIVYSIIKIKKSEKRLLEFLRRVLVIVLLVAYILSGYNWLWGIDYYSADTFSNQSGIPSRAPADPQGLLNVTVSFLMTANELSTMVERDEDGLFAEDMDEIFENSEHIYDTMFEVFPFLEGQCRKPKKMLFSDIMSLLGFTGIYFPFTGESNINMNQTPAFIPCTISHELAHQLGYTSEQECNFIGIVAGIASGDAAYQYSACLSGLLYLMNEVYAISPETWRELKTYFTPELKADWDANSKYWKARETLIDTLSSFVYDLYLKGNGQTMGIMSYSACVTMLVEYFKY